MADVKKIATRESYGNTLKELAAEGPRRSGGAGRRPCCCHQTGMFRKAYPDRHLTAALPRKT